jgi:hypothetical protein
MGGIMAVLVGSGNEIRKIDDMQEKYILSFIVNYPKNIIKQFAFSDAVKKGDEAKLNNFFDGKSLEQYLELVMAESGNKVLIGKPIFIDEKGADVSSD